ncbi:hypothetical protein MRX96_021464 [Rhipicephalus microplus]
MKYRATCVPQMNQGSMTRKKVVVRINSSKRVTETDGLQWCDEGDRSACCPLVVVFDTCVTSQVDSRYRCTKFRLVTVLKAMSRH